MSERFLILNADDFGMSHSTNEAIEDLFLNGFITSTSLMTPCPWAEDAASRVLKYPQINVGLHLTLNSEWNRYRWGPVSRKFLPTLVDDSGYFFSNVPKLLIEAKADEVLLEFNTQLEWMLKRGLKPTHIDNHMGSAYGLEGQSFLNEIFAICIEHKLPFRLPKNPEGFNLTSNAKNNLEIAIRYAENMSIALIDNLLHFSRKLTNSDTYETVRDEYIKIIRNSPSGISELYVHPAMECKELKAICGSWQMRVWEHRLMKDTDFLKAIEEEGIKLTGWRIFDANGSRLHNEVMAKDSI